LIFTAFADTADYLYDQLAPATSRAQHVYAAKVTGTGDNQTTLPRFHRAAASHPSSPTSMRSSRSLPRTPSTRKAVYPEVQGDIDLLIATDCISEGQNLQDCDYLVNYDIHWNPVRIIQRFGRIDRIGSRNAAIQLVNFWPDMDLDEYIGLKERVRGRMVLLDVSATGEENIIDEKAADGGMNDLEVSQAPSWSS
jgi:ERCC4-related helicase